MKWTPERLDWARGILGECTTLAEAARKIGVSYGALNCAFHNAGDAPGRYLKDAAPPVDPVARARAARAGRRVELENSALVTEVEALRAQVEAFSSVTAEPLEPIRRVELSSGLREATAVACLSDLHVEERVLPSDTPTGNAFNLAIADFRLSRAFAGIEWLVQMHRERFQIRNLVVWLGGDLGSGHIHEENVETSAMTPIATMLWLRPRLLDGIRRLADGLALERLDVVCSYGNHGRDTKKKRYATGAHHSYEWGMYQTLADNLAPDSRFSVLATPAAHQYHRIYDRQQGFHHGDDVRYNGGSGGLFIPLNKAVDAWNEVYRCDDWYFGHWHQYLTSGGKTVNGSMIGYNGFAMGIKARPEPPQQAFQLIDSKRGPCCRSPIWVGDPSAERELWAA